MHARKKCFLIKPNFRFFKFDQKATISLHTHLIAPNERFLKNKFGLSQNHRNVTNQVNWRKLNNKSNTNGLFYNEKIVLGYSREQMCDMVFDVAKYKEFVPFCIDSKILNESSYTTKLNLKTSKTTLNLKNLNLKNNKIESKNSTAPSNTLHIPQLFKARLEIGYPPIRESYTSHVSMIRPNLVKAISKDTNLFEYLINEWKFDSNPLEKSAISLTNPDKEVTNENSCLVEFYVSFKFHNPVYSAFSQIFMDQIFKKMVSAFTNRAQILYGKPSCLPKTLN